jgi:hypothetical protein
MDERPIAGELRSPLAFWRTGRSPQRVQKQRQGRRQRAVRGRAAGWVPFTSPMKGARHNGLALGLICIQEGLRVSRAPLFLSGVVRT